MKFRKMKVETRDDVYEVYKGRQLVAVITWMEDPERIDPDDEIINAFLMLDKEKDA